MNSRRFYPAKLPDSIDGRSKIRQTRILFTHLLLIFLSFALVTAFQWFLFILSGGSDEGYGDELITWITGPHLILSVALCLGFWYWIYVEMQLGWIIAKGNTVIPAINIFFPKQTKDGGTMYIIYYAGFSFADLWEEFYRAMDILREQTHSHDRDITISIKGVGLIVRLMLVWRPLLTNLSHYLQNGLDQAERIKILDALLAQAGQAAETVPQKNGWDSEEVRGKQDEVASEIKAVIAEKATEYGFEIDLVIFEKCDYSEEVQKQLDKKKETETIKDMAREIMSTAGGADKMSPEIAFEMASIISGVKGISRERKMIEIVADPAVAKAIADGGPALLAAWAAMREPKN